MKTEDIIRMAREACQPEVMMEWRDGTELEWWQLERFAALVAAAEREACASLCDTMSLNSIISGFSVDADQCADAIRARGSNENK